jgi:hypothetical protein
MYFLSLVLRNIAFFSNLTRWGQLLIIMNVEVSRDSEKEFEN